MKPQFNAFFVKGSHSYLYWTDAGSTFVNSGSGIPAVHELADGGEFQMLVKIQCDARLGLVLDRASLPEALRHPVISISDRR